MRRTMVFGLALAVSLPLLGIQGCNCVFDLDRFHIEEGGSGGTGGAGGAPPECIPGVASGPVESTCGKFVSALGKDSNDGTKDAPFKTLEKAIGEAKGDPVYVCTNGVSESITLTEDATIYGGLDCAQDWKYVGPDTKSPWTASADEVPLIVASGARATVEDIALTAADAKESGGSSVAVLAQVGAQLTLGRCDVTAGDGADGAIGETPDGAVMSGVDGNPGKAACMSDADQTGGSSAVLSCEGVSANSGAGGIGTTSDGGNGSDGKPSGATGKGGVGQVDANVCAAGGDAAVGMTGDAGLGAPMSFGTLGPDGYAGVSGTEGKPGLPGQGGGGGGGGKACSNGKAGASGGSGGSGACGGAGGKGGKAGGSSIGIAVVGAKLTLDTVNIVTKAGGKGGDGGAGQLGGSGGKVGAAGAAQDSSAACAGGKGGDGGPGGKGGGGLGGHSIGIAHTGEAPDTTSANITTGTAGDGGTGELPDGDGAAGAAAPTQKFN